MKGKLEKTFDKYVSNYDMNVNPVRYKYYHSYRVRDLMEILAKKLNLNKKEIEVAKVIGLLHDIGRFEQIRIHNSCSDVKTGMDHADESCIYLFDKGHIKDFYDDESYYDIIKDAIKNHNKYSIDKKVKGKNLLFSKMIRDMDKVDIYRVISEEFKTTYNYIDVSKDVIDMFNDMRPIHSELLKNKTDSVYCNIAMIYDINFKESFMILNNNKYLDAYFSVVIPEEKSVKEFENLKKKMNSYIEEQI